MSNPSPDKLFFHFGGVGPFPPVSNGPDAKKLFVLWHHYGAGYRVELKHNDLWYGTCFVDDMAVKEQRVNPTPEELAKQFQRAKPAAVAEILETLVTMGRAHNKGGKFLR